MEELLQAMRTFFYNRESDDDLAIGEKKEFLRGTFSVMDINEKSKNSLDKLKEKFMNCKKELGGLEVNEFEAALRPFITRGVTDSHIRTIFRKMDASDRGSVSWDEFINFAVTEHSMRLMMQETMDEMPFGQEVTCIRHQHRDPIVRIAFMPNIDVNAKSFDWNFGKYIVLSREGLMSIWSASMKILSYNNLVAETGKSMCWFLDMACIYHNGYVATISTSRDVALYDYTVRGWIRKYHLRGLLNCAVCMSYWADLKTEQAILVLGDTSGSVVVVEFDLSNLTPLFGQSVREGCYSVFWKDVIRGHCGGTTARVFSHVHSDWVKQVHYVPDIKSIMSCSIDNESAMHMTYIEPKKRPPTYFNTGKGILCFDYSHLLHVLACAGMEGTILLFNPYVPRKTVAAMEAHIQPVSHLKINEIEKYTISVDMSKTIIIFSLVNQVVLQRIPGQSVRTGLHAINTMFLHPMRRICLFGSKRMAMIKRHRLDDEVKVNVRSHDFKLVGALYSPEFEQVVSVCRGSTVRVWDLNTGTRVMQFSRAHEKKKQGEWVPVEIECIALSENRRRLFTAAEGIIKVWNFNTGSVLRTIDMTNSTQITSIVMAKQYIYVTGWHKYINVFSDFRGEEGLKRSWACHHISDCLSLCIMEPNMIASASYDGTVYIWSRETTDIYCQLQASIGPKPELGTSVRSGGAGDKQNIMSVAADMDTDGDGDDEGEDAFMTIGRHLRKEGGWYRALRALKKKQIEIQKKKALKEKKDFSARYKKKKKKINMQALSLIYESAVECMVFLSNRRVIDPHTATLVVAGAECWIRFWSIHPAGGILGQFNACRRKLESILCMITDKENNYLFTGDTLGFMRIFDIKEFCNTEKLTNEERETRKKHLKQYFVYTQLPFKPEEMLDTMEKLREKKISVPDASKPRKNLKAPNLLSSIRAHTMAITSLEYIEERHVILTASHDLTVRLWTLNCTYIGTFGEIWKPIPRVVGRVVERPPRIPQDVLRVASAHSLATLHNGKMPHWRNACYLVGRHIYEMKKEKQIEEQREKMKQEKLARGEVDSDEELTAEGEKPVSKILGKYYKPEKRFLGPINMSDQGLPKLRVFRGKWSPYNSIRPGELNCMVPLYKPPTFFDIHTRRSNNKSLRQTKQMMNVFNTICCDPERFGGGLLRGNSVTSDDNKSGNKSDDTLFGNKKSTSKTTNAQKQSYSQQSTAAAVNRSENKSIRTTETGKSISINQAALAGSRKGRSSKQNNNCDAPLPSPVSSCTGKANIRRDILLSAGVISGNEQANKDRLDEIDRIYERIGSSNNALWNSKFKPHSRRSVNEGKINDTEMERMTHLDDREIIEENWHKFCDLEPNQYFGFDKYVSPDDDYDDDIDIDRSYDIEGRHDSLRKYFSIQKDLNFRKDCEQKSDIMEMMYHKAINDNFDLPNIYPDDKEDKKNDISMMKEINYSYLLK